MSIQTDLTRIKNAKAAIKSAIEGKGVTVPDATLLDGMAALIESIQAGGGGGATEKKGIVIDEVDNYGFPTKASFYNQYMLSGTSIPFALFSKVPDIEGSYTSQGGAAWKNLTLVSLYNVETIEKCTFLNCSKLTKVNMDSVKIIESYAFQNCTSLILGELPKNTTRIYSYAFYNCTNLSITELPDTVIELGSYSFWKCLAIESLTFNGTPSSISSSAFTGCTNLTTINVPWAEGAVANAPWGAKNATINYNYTGG